MTEQSPATANYLEQSGTTHPDIPANYLKQSGTTHPIWSRAAPPILSAPPHQQPIGNDLRRHQPGMEPRQSRALPTEPCAAMSNDLPGGAHWFFYCLRSQLDTTANSDGPTQLEHGGTVHSICAWVDRGQLALGLCRTGQIVSHADLTLGLCRTGQIVSHADLTLGLCRTGQIVSHADLTLGVCWTARGDKPPPRSQTDALSDFTGVKPVN
ncbi:hypothetical protein EGW08_004263 [Elysia chlorotica]|uniref:Uncharacterized protein n=1 Tax=Elysia chlorotica TaxID=188477 RepID=A0A433U2F5_ELYCH|nr:hypothetical protein EGW08_004263 [Elysia chlorotica]